MLITKSKIFRAIQNGHCPYYKTKTHIKQKTELDNEEESQFYESTHPVVLLQEIPLVNNLDDRNETKLDLIILACAREIISKTERF